MNVDPDGHLDLSALLESLPEEGVRVPQLGAHGWLVRILWMVTSTYVGLLSVTYWGDARQDSLETSVILVFCWAFGLALGEPLVAIVQKHYQPKQISRLPADPIQAIALVSSRFRTRIKEERQRTLGPDSEWSRARAPLAKALDDANQSAKYWTARLQAEPQNETISQQLKVSQAPAPVTVRVWVWHPLADTR